VDARIKDALVLSTRNVFQTMVAMDVQVGDAGVDRARGEDFDFTGLISVCGRVSGAIGVHVSRPLAAHVGTKVLGCEIPEDSPDLTSLVGEMSNMIAGGVKTQLVGLLGYEFEISIPTVVSGAHHETKMLLDSANVSVPFSANNGRSHRFVVEAKLKIE
jgi:chemotaxis protein CheX